MAMGTPADQSTPTDTGGVEPTQNNGPSARSSEGPSWDLTTRVRMMLIVLMDKNNRSSLATTGLKATRKDLEAGDARKLSIWNDFATQMNDDDVKVAQGKCACLVI